jgi:hypothetical protein
VRVLHVVEERFQSVGVVPEALGPGPGARIEIERLERLCR